MVEARYRLDLGYERLKKTTCSERERDIATTEAFKVRYCLVLYTEIEMISLIF